MGATEQHQLDRLAVGWRMSPKWRILCREVVNAGGRPPGFVVTLSGYVVAGADIVGARWAGTEIEGDARKTIPSTHTIFDLRPPGEWFEDWRGRLLPTQAGGASLRMWPLGWKPPWERRPRDRAVTRMRT